MPEPKHNFSHRLKVVLARTRTDAVRAGTKSIDTEHQLSAVLAHLEATAPGLVSTLRLEPEQIGRLFTTSEPIAETAVVDANDLEAMATAQGFNLPYASGAKRALELAMTARRELNHPHVEPEHLLIGLIGEETGLAGKVLRQRGLSRDQVSRAVEQHFAGGGGSSG